MIRQKFLPVQVQRAILAPVMQKSITVLLLPITELAIAIEQELQTNPLLEFDETYQQILSAKQLELRQKIRSLDTASPQTLENTAGDEDEPTERPVIRETTLEEYLLRQLRFITSDSLQLKIGEQIIGNIDEDGYLTVTCDEIVQNVGTENIELAEKVLSDIQQLDPLGIASRTLKECLLLQVDYYHHQDVEIIKKIINDYLMDLGNRKFKEIAKKMNLSEAEVKKFAQIISALEPKPARNFRPIDASIYVKPDVTIRKNEDSFTIQINSADAPALRINPLYKNMLNRPNLSEQERTFIEEKLQNALYFLKSIRQREETLTKIVNHILEKQIHFFTQGPSALVPLTLKDVATTIGRDESTVSRAIRSKFIETPQGLYPMKFFFSGSFNSETNGAHSTVASRSIQEEIKDLIGNEEKSSPLSDQEIQAVFEKRGITVARRTISKYRQALKIPPSHLRKD